VNYSIDHEFKALIRSLTGAEYSALEASIVAEGCRDALVIWRGYGIIVDGHNRYDICQKHGIAFRVEERDFPDRQAVKVWILKNQLARRNLTDGERAELPDYITSPEAQKLLGVNRQRISALLKTGQLRGKKDGRRWMIERASVEERLKALRK